MKVWSDAQKTAQKINLIIKFIQWMGNERRGKEGVKKSVKMERQSETHKTPA